MKGIKWLVWLLVSLILFGTLWLVYKNINQTQPNSFPNSTPSTTLTPTNQPSPTLESICQAINMIAPKANDIIVSPLKITVIIDNSKTGCHWTVFEAQAGTLILKDSKGVVLGTGILKTTEDWTTNTPVTYTSTITFTQSNEKNLTLLVNEENPSGKPNAQSISIQVNQK